MLMSALNLRKLLLDGLPVNAASGKEWAGASWGICRKPSAIESIATRLQRSVR
jgi:hypothetical protein